jgi:two-component system cell cycle sensor histidine kinase/response regulator CckA
LHRTDPASGQLPRTILLVEDEAFVREVAYEVLSCAGYRVLKAANATEAVQVFREQAGAVQLLLTDVVLPDRNGCDLALELSTLNGGVKSIFVSGYPENVITKRGLRQPGWFYLPKPFSVASLMQKIKEALPNEALPNEALPNEPPPR